MTTTQRTRATRVLVPLALAGAVGAALVAPVSAVAAPATAAADPGFATATYAGPGVGYNKVIDGRSAGSVFLKVEKADPVEVFCIDYVTELATSGTFTATTYAKSKVANVAKAADLAVRHKSISGVLAEPRAENSATQLAIWKLTNNKDFSAVPNAAIVARANQLVAAAKPHAEGLSGLALTASVATETPEEGTAAVAKEKLTVRATNDGLPVTAAIPVVAKVNGSTFTSKTVNGVATFTIPASSTGGTVDVSATATLAAGTVVVPAGKQPMVTTEAVSITRTATATLPVHTVPKATPSPTSSAPVPVVPKATPKPPVQPPTSTPTPSKPAPKPVIISEKPAPKKLPYTGGWAEPWMLAVAGLGTLGAGVGAHRLLRRRG